MDKQPEQALKLLATLSQFQARVHASACAKGWSDSRILDPATVPTEAEIKLAKLASGHTEIDALAELIRKDPSIDIGRYNSVHVPEAPDCCLAIVLSKLVLISTENTEAIGAVVKNGLTSYLDPALANASMTEGKPEGLGSELSDIVLRCFQLAAQVGIDLGAECVRKLDYNAGRPVKHGKHA